MTVQAISEQFSREGYTLLKEKIQPFTLKGEKSIRAKLNKNEKEHADAKGWVVVLNSADEEGIAVSQ